MRYAIIENGTVANVIWLYPANASEFPNAVQLGDRPVEIGDTVEDGRFFRDGSEVLTGVEELELALNIMMGVSE